MGKQTRQSTDTVEFTHSWYEEFLNDVREAGYDFRRFSDPVDSGTALLRHDVDLSVADALTMARIEAEHNVQATYCFLFTSGLYNPLEESQREQIRGIESLGHEVALHFSTHEYWDSDAEPDEEELLERIDDERTALETVVSDTPGTVSFHIPPEWVLGRSFDSVRNTYAPEYFTEMDYVADSGQRWRKTPPEIETFGESVQILTHPGLWSRDDGSFQERVERSVTASCRRTQKKAHAEFLAEGGS